VIIVTRFINDPLKTQKFSDMHYLPPINTFTLTIRKIYFKHCEACMQLQLQTCGRERFEYYVDS